MGGSKCDFLFSGSRLLARDLGRVVGSREFLVAFGAGRFLSEPDARAEAWISFRKVGGRTGGVTSRGTQL